MSRLVPLLGFVFFAGCANLQSASRGRQLAPPPGATGPLRDLEDRLRTAAGPDKSGFTLLEVNREALEWRLALIDSAKHSLDLMTFIWWGDEAGELVLKRVIDAADRGVKVRLIVDDMTTIDDGKELRLRDVPNAAIDAHPNIELRVFNPWNNREAVGRATEFVVDFKRLNQRMHNKALIADNRAAIMGGRNLGNEYFGLHSDFNFHDVDVLSVGPATRQVSGVFDRYWNSEWVVPLTKLADAGTKETLAQERAELEARLRASTKLAQFPLAPADWSEQLRALAMDPGTSTVITDAPDQGITHHMPETVRALWAGATKEVLVANAYIIPEEEVFKRTAAELKPGVRFVMLTNSLGSTDAAGVHAHYTDWRPRMVAGGVELYELRHDAKVRATLADTKPVESGFIGLHAKVMVVDQQRVLIGSMNLDPRSWNHNTEMGMLIECPSLAAQLAKVVENDLKPENAWRIALDEAGGVTWNSGAEVRRDAPVRDESQRREELLHLLLPADLY
jgi:putative cardiolipin synthase